MSGAGVEICSGGSATELCAAMLQPATIRVENSSRRIKWIRDTMCQSFSETCDTNNYMTDSPNRQMGLRCVCKVCFVTISTQPGQRNSIFLPTRRRGEGLAGEGSVVCIHTLISCKTGECRKA